MTITTINITVIMTIIIIVIIIIIIRSRRKFVQLVDAPDLSWLRINQP